MRTTEATHTSSGVWSVQVPFVGRNPPTNCYIVEGDQGQLTVIDPGHDTVTNRAIVSSALRQRGRSEADVTAVILTHAHSDHAGLARWLAVESGGPVFMEPAGHDDASLHRYSSDVQVMARQWGVPEESVARLRLQRTILPITLPVTTEISIAMLRERTGRDDLTVIPTPGHTRGHVCVVLTSERLVLTGDHILPRINPGIGLGDVEATNPVADYIRSIERLSGFDHFKAGPGHGSAIHPLGERRRELLAHVLRRAEEVRRAETKLTADATTWQVASAVSWSNGWESMSGSRLQSALRQVAFYREYVRRLT